MMTAINLGDMALLSASATVTECAKQQSTTNNVETKVSVDIGAAGGGSRALEHSLKIV